MMKGEDYVKKKKVIYVKPKNCRRSNKSTIKCSSTCFNHYRIYSFANSLWIDVTLQAKSRKLCFNLSGTVGVFAVEFHSIERF